ncbi:MAG: hypothetical protein E6H09_09005 [Bacteroidetes bacterium]|nr:MAG: hypothetical protein E6H09_09005 [Bacteroidota bacterium]
MKRIVLSFFVFTFSFTVSFSQKVSAKPQFQQGQIIGIMVELKTTVSQEAGGQAIDFTANGSAWHSFKVTNATDNNTTLHHDVKRISFNFDGMGQKRSVDSDNPKDLEGFLGKPVKEILGKSYDMIIDPAGTTLLTKPEKIQLSKTDDRLAVVFNLLKDITGIIYPPKKGDPSFFKVMPDTATGLNGSWSESGVDSTGMYKTTYTLSAITDSTIVVDLKGNSSTITKNEMMGMQTTTNMNSTYTGRMIIDKLTGIIREKTITTSSNGSTEAMGGTMPVTSKTTIVIRVKPAQIH